MNANLNIFLKLWFVYPLLVPFYLMGKTPIPGTEKVEGGVPQIADYYLIAFMALVLCKLPFRLRGSAVMVAQALVCFIGWTAVVNLAWSTELEDLSLVKSSLYYVYDGLLLFTCLVLYANFKEQFLYVTVQSVGTSVVLQAILSPLAPQGNNIFRQAAFFNNENQLGYFCVLAATIFVLGARRFSIRLRYQAIFFAALGYLALISQSRGGLLGLGVLTVVSCLGRPVRLLFTFGGAAVVYLVLALTPQMLSKSDGRLVTGGEYDTPATRGYDRIVNYPEYTLLGAGEGVYERFRSELYASEIHSSYGTLLFCYGIPGTLLFTLMLLFICQSDPWIGLYLIPAFVHGVGHQGLRFAFFWTMLAFLCAMAMDARHRNTRPDFTDGPGDEDPAIGPAA
jgi:hypothetical protein